MNEQNAFAQNIRQTRVVIFAKAPIPGFCKTRLISVLGAQGAAELAAKMLSHTVAIAKEAQIGPVELCVAPDPGHECFHSTALDEDLLWSRQSEGDLGQRMSTAVHRTLSEGQNILCIGTDCLELEACHLREAAQSLSHHTAVITPALDGGYVMLGLNRFDDSIFKDIAWSTPSVFNQSMTRIKRLGWSVREMKALRDIDEPEDLAFLPEAFKKIISVYTDGA